MLAMFFFDERSKDWNEIKKFFVFLRDGFWKEEETSSLFMYLNEGSKLYVYETRWSFYKFKRFFEKTLSFSEAQFNAFFFSRFLIFHKYAKGKEETAFAFIFFFLLFIRGQSESFTQCRWGLGLTIWQIDRNLCRS